MPGPSCMARMLVAAEWLKECIEGHPSCTTPNPQFMPSRLIDVGLEGSEPFLVDSNLEPAPYVALSYCWGTVENSLTTTRENIAEHRRCISLSLFPQVCFPVYIGTLLH